jgi:hypothetical protein
MPTIALNGARTASVALTCSFLTQPAFFMAPVRSRGCHVLAARQAGDRPLDVFIAGDDAEAKARVSAFIESLALRPLDTGGLTMAHWLEGAGLLMMRLVIGRAVKDGNFSLGISIPG